MPAALKTYKPRSPVFYKFVENRKASLWGLIALAL